MVTEELRRQAIEYGRRAFQFVDIPDNTQVVAVRDTTDEAVFPVPTNPLFYRAGWSFLGYPAAHYGKAIVKMWTVTVILTVEDDELLAVTPVRMGIGSIGGRLILCIGGRRDPD